MLSAHDLRQLPPCMSLCKSQPQKFINMSLAVSPYPQQPSTGQDPAAVSICFHLRDQLRAAGMCRVSTTLKASWLMAKPTKRMMGAMPQGGIKALHVAKRPAAAAASGRRPCDPRGGALDSQVSIVDKMMSDIGLIGLVHWVERFPMVSTLKSRHQHTNICSSRSAKGEMDMCFCLNLALC